MQEEPLEINEEVSPSVIYQQDKAAIDMQIATAKAYPRNVKRSVENAIDIVTIDQETAMMCSYSLPRDGKAITGPSVHLAKILAQVWGNMRIEAKVVSIDNRQITSEAVCFDLENNLAIKAQVKRSIIGRRGRYGDDMITVTGNAANAIALRNAVLSVIPRAVVDKVYNAAKQLMTGDTSDDKKLDERRTKVVNRLKNTYQVTDEEILKAVGRKNFSEINADDIIVLIGIGTAIKDGDTTVEKAFRGKVEKQAPSGNKKFDLP